jgi:hypothetical protein
MRSKSKTQRTDPYPPARPTLAALAIACLLPSGCGTDVEWLLERDSVLVARADKAAASAEAIEPELTTAMYDAEDAKQAACESIYTSVSEQMTRPPSYGEELESDIGAFVAYLFPIEEVERCADAQRRYESAVEALERRISPSDGTKADGD